MCLTARNALKANHCVQMGEMSGFFVNTAMGMWNAMRFILIIKWRQKGGQRSIFFQKRKRAQTSLAQIHLSSDHIRKTMKVISSTSYPLSVAFLFFLCCPCWWERRFIKFHRTVSDNIAYSTDYHLGTLKFLVRSLNILNKKSEKYLSITVTSTFSWFFFRV